MKPRFDPWLYVDHPPPEPSSGLLKWQAKIAGGWKPNARIRRLGWESSVEFFRVYAWEWKYVLRDLVHEPDPFQMPYYGPPTFGQHVMQEILKKHHEWIDNQLCFGDVA